MRMAQHTVTRQKSVLMPIAITTQVLRQLSDMSAKFLVKLARQTFRCLRGVIEDELVP